MYLSVNHQTANISQYIQTNEVIYFFFLLKQKKKITSFVWKTTPVLPLESEWMALGACSSAVFLEIFYTLSCAVFPGFCAIYFLVLCLHLGNKFFWIFQRKGVWVFAFLRCGKLAEKEHLSWKSFFFKTLKILFSCFLVYIINVYFWFFVYVLSGDFWHNSNSWYFIYNIVFSWSVQDHLFVHQVLKFHVYESQYGSPFILQRLWWIFLKIISSTIVHFKFCLWGFPHLFLELLLFAN